MIASLNVSKVERKILAQSFGEEVARKWPHTKEEAMGWVLPDYLNPKTIAISLTTDDGQNVGGGYISPFGEILPGLPNSKIVSSVKIFIDKHLAKTAFFGGVFVKEEFQGRGYGAEILRIREQTAKEKGFEYGIVFTALPNEKYKDLKMISILKKAGWKVLNTEPIKSRTYDLEEVWLFKKLV